MSDPVQAERAAFRELETAVGHLAEELASFRRRALTAEARLRELDERTSGGDSATAVLDRIGELERENAALSAKLAQATERARQMLDRVRFLRQQARGGGDK
jgi:hypothetical protein